MYFCGNTLSEGCSEKCGEFKNSRKIKIYRKKYQKYNKIQMWIERIIKYINKLKLDI